MKTGNSKQRLLDEVLAQSEGEDFAQAALVRALGAARHRRRMRRGRNVLLAMCALAAIPLILLRPGPTPKNNHVTQTPPPTAAAPVIGFVTTQPLPPGMLLQTRSNLFGWIKTDLASVTPVPALPPAGLYRALTDDDLLALVASQPVALVRHTLTRATLVMPDELRRSGFPVPH